MPERADTKTDKLEMRKLPAGIYAAFKTECGRLAWEEFPKLFELIFDSWLPASEYKQKYDLAIEVLYLWTDHDLRQKNRYYEVWIPVEAASTDGYKKRVPWKEKDYSVDEVSSWGLSMCSEPEGSTGRKNNSIFFALGNGYIQPNGAQMRDLKITMEQFSDLTVLKVFYALYGLTLSEFDLYVTADEIAAAAHLKIEEVENTLRDFPLTVKEEDGKFKYRLEGSFSHIPPLLSFFYKL